METLRFSNIIRELISWRRIILAVSILGIILILFKFCNNGKPVEDHIQLKLTHEQIESIDGMFPIKAVRQGKMNSPYIANGKQFIPIKKKYALGFTQSGIASWYGEEKLALTISGEMYNPNLLTAAHETLPIPSWVRLTNKENRLSTIVKINDRGPFEKDRIINISFAAAKALKFEKKGTTEVYLELIRLE
jgi:rare lipoprotein A